MISPTKQRKEATTKAVFDEMESVGESQGESQSESPAKQQPGAQPERSPESGSSTTR